MIIFKVLSIPLPTLHFAYTFVVSHSLIICLQGDRQKEKGENWGFFWSDMAYIAN